MDVAVTQLGRNACGSALSLYGIAFRSGLAFALSVAAANPILSALDPSQSDAAAEVTAYYTENQTALATVIGMAPFALVTLYLSVSTSYPRLSQPSPEAAACARPGAIGAYGAQQPSSIRPANTLGR